MRECMVSLWERSVSPLIFLDGALINAALQQRTTACSHAFSVLPCMAAQNAWRKGCLCWKQGSPGLASPASFGNARAARNAPHFTTYACLTLLMLQHQASAGVMKIMKAAHREVQYLAACCGLPGIYMSYEYNIQMFPADVHPYISKQQSCCDSHADIIIAGWPLYKIAESHTLPRRVFKEYPSASTCHLPSAALHVSAAAPFLGPPDPHPLPQTPAALARLPCRHSAQPLTLPHIMMALHSVQFTNRALSLLPS